jgi:hypothetical protein
MDQSPLRADPDRPLPTVSTALDNGCQVDALCHAFNNVSRFALSRLAAFGYADVALIHLPLRRVCGSRSSRIIVSGRAFTTAN